MKTKRLGQIVMAGAIAMLSFSAAAQDDARATGGSYTNAIGLRAGETSGLTVKHFTGNGNAIEGILSGWPGGVSITGLYEWYVPAGKVNGLSWYYGAGAHVAFNHSRWYYVYREGNRYYTYRYYGWGVGVDGTLGVEYKIPRVPIALSCDLKPFIEVGNSGYLFTAIDPGLGIKVTF